MEVNGNEVEIKISVDSNINSIFGGRACKGTVSSNAVTISSSAKIEHDVYGAYIGKEGRTDETYGYASSNTVTIISGTVQNVYGGYIEQKGTATLNTVHLTSVTTVNGDVYGARIGSGYASSNTVTIIDGIISGVVGDDVNVYGGYIVGNGTATLNEVNLTSVTVSSDVYGARIGNGLARDNRVTIKGGKIVGVSLFTGSVYGGYIEEKGTATLNRVNLTSVTVGVNVYGARIGSGLASSNTVTIISGRVGRNVYGGYIGQNGTASSNTVTINGGKTVRNVFGGYVKGNGKATHNTITITGSVEFSTATILCGGICANKATADASTNDAFTGNTLNIVETKGVVVNGISNFENYNFH